MTTALTAAWQAGLAAEHRAVFAYGLIGAQLHGTEQVHLAIRCSNAHEQLRDNTAEAIAAGGLTAVAAAADYPDLYPVSTVTQARALAPRIEDDCAAAWRYLYFVAASTRGAPAMRLRSVAQAGLTSSAVRATEWRLLVSPSSATVAFPGL